MDRQVEDAKQKLAKKDKKGAMFALKKKKMLGTQVDSILGTMITMEQQKMALENAATNRLAVDAIGGANAAIGTAMGGYDVEKVEEIMDQVQEGIQDAEEIGSVLARGLGGADVMDDEELLAELNEMEQVTIIHGTQFDLICNLFHLFFNGIKTCLRPLASSKKNRTNSHQHFLRFQVCLPGSPPPPWTSPLRPKASPPRQLPLLLLRKMRTREHFGNSKPR
mmetsp:Transcript_65990/g.132911  ORF Transcript_65990/g.132911 Transcript_65990/m.132911 type:complete len:222 (-) Transcript_65990:259-924(-)